MGFMKNLSMMRDDVMERQVGGHAWEGIPGDDIRLRCSDCGEVAEVEELHQQAIESWVNGQGDQPALTAHELAVAYGLTENR